MDKFENLEKLQNLKESGAITEEEFQIEKQKILKEENTIPSKPFGNKKISITFFILSIILFVVTISFIAFSIYWSNEQDDASDDYFMAKWKYEDYKEDRYRYRNLYEDAKEEFEDEEKKYDKISKTYHFFEYGRYVTAGLCVATLGTGFLLKEKKNKKGKK